MAASPGTAEPLESSTTEHPGAVQLPPLPIDEAEPSPPLLGAAAAHEAISPRKSASPSPLPANMAVEVSPEVEASSSSPSPSPSPSQSPQIVEASPGAPKPLSPPRTAPAAAERASTDLSITEAVAMASQEGARPSPSPESMDAHLHTASAPLTPPMEIGPGGLLPQQQPQPPSPEMAPPLCDYSEPAQPSPLCHPDECTGASPDAPVDEVVAGTSGKAARPSPCENSEFAQLPQPHLPAESTYVCSNAAGKVSAVASEDGTQPAMESIDSEGPLEIGVQRSLQEPEETTTPSRMEAEPCSPEMAPPGFEDCKSQWLPLSDPNPLVESTHTVVQVTATNAMDTTPDTATGSLSPGLLPLLKRGAEGQHPRSCSPTTEAEPGSPDMPPPGFENCKSSWLPLPTLQPVAETTYVSHDVAPTKTMAVGFMEKACSVVALERTDVEIDSERSLLPPLESGTGSSLQGPLPRLPSPMMRAIPCSPDTAPPGFENLKFTQLPPPSLPLVQTAHVLQNSADNEAMSVISEEAPQPSPAVDAMDLDINAKPVLALPSESKPGKSLPPEPTLLLSHVAQHTTCSLGMVLLGSENIKSSQMLLPALVLPLDQTPDILADAGTKKTVTIEGVCHPPPVAGATEEANGSVLPPATENGCEGQSPQLEPQASSPAVDAAATSLEIAPRSFENSESSQLISPCLAETIDPSTHASATMPVLVKSEKTSLPLSPLQATGTDMESTILQQSPSKSEERSLAEPEQHLSSPSVKGTTCSPEVAPPGYENFDSLDQPPPPPPLCSKFEHQVGKMYCGQCDTLLMYPFGAPAVKCSNCLFVTEIGERNVRPRILMEQSVSPDPQEVVHQS
ncbi:hypothetical protein SORBI_3003G218700 [Sorghum bicolor]|uniref:Zinc finger LSD1-type domain-containing protein n=1 Tax=Sorghum bicolor TaxID=4558 RepID=A0A1W0VYF5_SORBI|nr:hypothetical protein SORBI_3003G218700 [Sorghum bicolor]